VRSKCLELYSCNYWCNLVDCLVLVSVAERLCEQGSMVVANHTVYITKPASSAVKKQSCSADCEEADLMDTEAEDSTDSCTVFVEDVPSDLVEFLKLHLESRNRGGGAIEKLIYKDGGILVTFEELQGAVYCDIDSRVEVPGYVQCD